jgi:hypothetical protein
LYPSWSIPPEHFTTFLYALLDTSGIRALTVALTNMLGFTRATTFTPLLHGHRKQPLDQRHISSSSFTRLYEHSP